VQQLLKLSISPPHRLWLSSNHSLSSVVTPITVEIPCAFASLAVTIPANLQTFEKNLRVSSWFVKPKLGIKHSSILDQWQLLKGDSNLRGCYC
jgi:hypothetical protein